jgi:hypothetical protein
MDVYPSAQCRKAMAYPRHWARAGRAGKEVDPSQGGRVEGKQVVENLCRAAGAPPLTIHAPRRSLGRT